jgi:hypothetical protein
MAKRDEDSEIEWKITDEWIAWVTRRMRERKLSQRSLGALVGSSGAAISDLLSKKSGGSRLVPKINVALGAAPPIQILILDDETKARLDAKWSMLTEEQRDAVVHMVEMIAGGAKPR